ETVDQMKLTYQLFGFTGSALKQSNQDSIGSAGFLEADQETGEIRSELYWMPFPLKLDLDESQQVFVEQLTTATTLPELLDSFKEGFRQKIDYRLILAMAFTLGAWDEWESASLYCDLAKRERQLEQQGPSIEVSLLTAVCLHMERSRGNSRRAKLKQAL